MNNETKQAEAIAAIEALKTANDLVQSKGRELQAEQQKGTPGLEGERRRKKLELENLEARDALYAARARAQSAVDSLDAEAGKVETPATLLAKVRERLDTRAQLADAINKLDADLNSELLEASRALTKERTDRGLPLPAVHVLIGKVQLPQDASSAKAKAYLPTALADLTKLLADAVESGPTTSIHAEHIRQERGKLRAIEIAIATEKAALEESKKDRERLEASEARRATARAESDRLEAEERRKEQAAERRREDELLAGCGRGFGGAA